MEKVVNRFTTWHLYLIPNSRARIFKTCRSIIPAMVRYTSVQAIRDNSSPNLQSKSKKSKPEPKSPSPATSSPEIAESEESKSQAETLTAKVIWISHRSCLVRSVRILNVSQSSPPPKEDFESYYLKRVTAEFADDIDRLRNAPDFNERSVPVLIAALKGGSKGFSEDEKEKLIKAR